MNRIVKLSVLLVAVIAAACNGNTGNRNMSTVSVTGTGTVMAQPDMVRINISLNHTAATTGAAQEAVNKMVAQALEVLKGYGIEDKNIATASLTFSPEYEWRTTGRVLLGQNVRQTINFSVNDIQRDDERIAQIIDKLVKINGIELSQINFSVKDNTAFFVQSRELAFQKATEKANQFAELSGLKVGRVLSIAEEGAPQVLPMNKFVTQSNVIMEAAADLSSTSIPTGELEMTTRISVVFILE